jgi:tyrosine-protein kinase Etk/Wzc
MTQQDTIALGHFSTAEPETLTAQSRSEISLIDIAVLFLRHKKLIGGATLATALLAAIAVWFLPPSYVAEATILPPQQQQSSLAALAAGAMGG